jgi:hypothetical protein
MIDVQEIYRAIDRIARTPDGELLYRYLQREALSLPPDAASDGALREHSGRRRFALDLMACMAKGIDERAGRRSNDSTPDGIAEQPAVYSRQPARIAGRASFREHAERTDPELARIAADTKRDAG